MGSGAILLALLLRVTIVDREREIPRLQALHLDVAGSDVKAQTVDVIGDRGTYDLLRSQGFLVTVRPEPPFEPAAGPLTLYMDPGEINARLDAFVASYPAIAAKVAYGTTEEGRPVYALKISDQVAVEEDEPAIFFVAQHHAREVMTPEIAIDIAEQLLTGYGVDPKITAWVSTREIFILPNHNPDGSQYVFDHDKSWRKNRRDNGDRTFGVDLNRNYPFHWNGGCGSSGDPGDDGYRGPAPASEPETGGINTLARAQRPVISLSYHTYGEQVLMPYGCPGVLPAERAVFRSLSSDLSSLIVSDNGSHWYTAGAPWEILYPEDGETNAWFYGDNATYAFEIEANASSQGFQPAFGTWRDVTVQRQRPAWRYLLDRLDGPGISTHVTDACTGAPLAASVALDEIVFGNGETARTAEPLHGRFQWLTTDGTFHLRAGKAEYAEQVWPVTVGAARVDRPVRLVPAGSAAVAATATVIEDGAGDGDGEADPGEAATVRVRAANVGASALSGVTATLTTSDPYVTITDGTASYGTIAAGADAPGDGFGVTVAAGAPDQHVATLHVAFGASQPLCAAADDVQLRITTGRAGCTVVENLDVNPGWTIVNSTTGGWAFGAPLGDDGANGPASAFTGAAVYGTNLSGLYANNADYQLTTVAYDLQRLRHATLSFHRWLDNERGFDIANVDLSNDGGASWQPLDSGFAYGEGWEARSIDVAALADGRPDVRFRFRLRSDGGTVKSGFYVDDLTVCGEQFARRPNGVGASLRLARVGADLRLDWTASPVDAAHDAATGYRIYRSSAPAAGYAVAETSATIFAVEPGEASSPATRYYLVVAENLSGTSPDVPSP